MKDEERSQERPAEEDLQHYELKYSSLFRNMLDGFAYHRIVLDEKGKPVDYIFLEVNAAFEAFTGLKRKETIDRRVTEIIPGIQEEDPDLISLYGDVALTGESIKFELYFEPFKKWYLVSAYSYEKGYFAAIFDDITDLKNSEIACLESEERFRNIFEEAKDGILVADVVDRKFFMTNRTACKMLGYSQEEMLKMGVQDIHPEEHWPSALAQFEKLMKKEIRLAKDVPVKRKDGSIFYTDISGSRLVAGGKRYMVGIFRDMTESRQAKAEIDKRVAELEEFYEIAVGRELQMKKLMKEIEKLKSKLAQNKE